MKDAQVTELLLQALEHEKGGVQIYETALKCAVHPELADEWQKYLDQTRMHVRVLTEVISTLKIDLYTETPGRKIVRQNGAGLVQAMETALQSAEPDAAQLIACDCVVLAETKDHANWELIGQVAKNMSGEAADALTNAYEQIEDEEDEHLYHSKGWCRELWLQSLGLDAVLPPPEETENVRSAKEEAMIIEKRAHA
jgi:hypothetical protein